MSDEEVVQSDDSVVTESGDTEGTKLEVNRSPEDYARALVEASSEAKKYRTALKSKKDETADLRAQVRNLEEAKLTEQGHFKELAAQRATEVEELKTVIQNTNARSAHAAVTRQVELEAARMGCQNIGAAIKLSSFGDLEVDEDFNVNAGQIKDMLELVQKEVPGLFQKAAPVVHDGVPAKPHSIDPATLGGDDLKRKLKEVMHARAQLGK